MALTAKLELRQSQQLVMTPQLQQAIKLLQLSNMELSAFVDSELERNPLLEIDEAAERPAERVQAERDERADREPSDEADVMPAASDEALDSSYEDVYPDADATDRAMAGDPGWASLRQGQRVGDGEDTNLEEFVSEHVSLKVHLEQQASLALGAPADRMIARYLIDMVDEAGYLRGDLDALAARLGAPRAMLERVLAELQKLDPPGVFARSLQECLKLQLVEQNRFDPRIGALIDNLDLLAGHNLAALRRACGCDSEELAEMIAEIKGLNPKPGLQFGHAPVQPVVPDVLVRPRSDGGWHVELNSETLPKLLVNQSYYAVVSGSSRNERDKSYLQECLQTANWLVKSLDQRARTIMRVSEEIVRQQDAFFAHGVQYLRPLNLKTVADAISMHESTVSRVTSNKYMATSRGIFELKYFFTSAISSADAGEAHSSEAVRHRIKQMIDAEPAADVLSDDKIVEKLRTDGIDIARRTVAKYREAMRIPSSVQRRREKRLTQRLSGAA
jgi:RNA polymerase sigma-54 factor